MTHQDIIRDLGGPVKTARLLGRDDNSALHWGTKGIPARHWHEIERLTDGRVTAAELARTTPRDRLRTPDDAGVTIQGAPPPARGRAA